MIRFRMMIMIFKINQKKLEKNRKHHLHQERFKLKKNKKNLRNIQKNIRKMVSSKKKNCQNVKKENLIHLLVYIDYLQRNFKINFLYLIQKILMKK